MGTYPGRNASFLSGVDSENDRLIVFYPGERRLPLGDNIKALGLAQLV
jgi:hypothetical protein